MTTPVIFESAEIVTADDRFRGHVVVEDGLITEVGRGRAPERGIDCAGDFLMPGLVEIHTDHLEAHYMPRPKVAWNTQSAVCAYDAQIAASGITTVFDSLRIGEDWYETRTGVGSMVFEFAAVIQAAGAAGCLKAEHLTHIRCEIPAPDATETLAKFLDQFSVHLISLMDHTPGQRQFRNLEKYFEYYGGKSGKSPAEVNEVVKFRQSVGSTRAAQNKPLIVEIAKKHGITMASHDDTTVEDVKESVDAGITVAEFPTTLASASASREYGMATVMGAPNVVRGGSHSGNVSAQLLADEGLLDMLSSDYVPASLLLGAMRLQDSPGIEGLPGAIRLVSKNPADALGLTDRGAIAVGKKADLLRVRELNGHPIVREVWRRGARVN